MRIWVTRAEPGAAATAQRLRDLGHDPVVAPLLEVRPLDTPLDLAGIVALAFTSINGVTAFADREPLCDLPVFAVGDATADAARGAGFQAVESADGDVHALAALIAARWGGREGALLHPGARESAGDLVGDLARLGVPARACAVYETVALPALVEPDELDAVLVHSPRAARLLAAEVDARSIPALCISPAAAAPLLEQNFSQVVTAPFPNEAALLKLIPLPPAEGAAETGRP